MTDPISLRDQLAMSAPIAGIEACHLECSDADQDKQFEQDIRLRYRYADIALRVRAETMVKVERQHPEWASWAARDEDGECMYFNNEPILQPHGIENMNLWCNPPEGGQFERVEGDTTWIPTNWRESKVRLTPPAA